VQDAVSTKLSVVIRYSVQALLGVALMLFMSWRLALAIVLAVLILVGVSLLFIRNLRGAARAYQDRLSIYVAYVAEVFGGIKVVRNLGASEQVLERARGLNSAVSSSGERRIVWGAAFSSGASALLNILLLLVAGYGASLVFAGDLTLDQFIAFILYGAIVAVSFSFLLGAYGDLIQGLGGLERVLLLIGDAVNSESHFEGVDTDKAALFKGLGGMALEFSGVTFSYPLAPSESVLEDLSVRIGSGEFVGVVGPSGCGKSTLAQLILGLYQPQRGVISLGDLPLGEFSAGGISNFVSWVPQEPMLFDCSVIDNLLLGNPGLLRDEALKVLLSWGFLDFVEQLALRFDTVLGERGASLSGGQRQRLAIARALLRRPKVLILDEATAGLDSELEELVFKVVRGYLPEATVVVISHRLSSVSGADRILVIEDGRIVQSGTHRQLLMEGGIYQRYYQRQGLG
jgi:ATP-binding cassette subfamily B protein